MVNEYFGSDINSLKILSFIKEAEAIHKNTKQLFDQTFTTTK